MAKRRTPDPCPYNDGVHCMEPGSCSIAEPHCLSCAWNENSYVIKKRMRRFSSEQIRKLKSIPIVVSAKKIIGTVIIPQGKVKSNGQ